MHDRCIAVLLIGVALAACGGGDPVDSGGNQGTIEMNTTITPHNDSACSGAFVRHDLDHTTTPRGDVAAMVDGTGSGVYADDLDDDGLVDIVLPNLSGDSTVLWNDGALSFSAAPLTSGRFRQAAAADLDADGDRDLILTTGIGPPVALLQGPGRTFERTEIRTRAVAFSVAPGDLDGDGSVELATGSYNAELTQNRDNRVLTGTDVGVAVLAPTADTLSTGVDTRYLSDSAQALATLVVDVDGDGLSDVVVGNDLGTPDRIWLASSDLAGVDGLTVTELFDVTSLSTMSIDVADIDNDGDRDLVSTDMARMPGESAAVWEALDDDIAAARVDDVQQPRNVVQLAIDGSYSEQAVDLGVAATGWSWSGLLGDLDDDGFVDLYVVNGMQATSIFEDLPGGELVEENQAFANIDGRFEARPDWGLGSTDGGRGMAQADLDGDGDLDIVVNNLGTPSTLWENQLCGGSSVVVEPIWTSAQNVDALGTTVTVDDGSVARTAIITGARGYISTSATQAHVGLGSDADAVTITVRWPDGAIGIVGDVAPDSTIRVERS